MKIILDASAWIEYFQDTPHAVKIEEYLQKNECITLSISLAEVTAKALLAGKNPDEAIRGIQVLSRIMPADEELALSAAQIYSKKRKTHTKFSLSDAFLVALAQKIEAKILTKDSDFVGFREAIILR